MSEVNDNSGVTRRRLSQLIQDLEEGVISEGDRKILMDLLRGSAAARRQYLEHFKMVALLQEAAQSRGQMGSMPVSQQTLSDQKRRSVFIAMTYGIAALLVVGIGLMLLRTAAVDPASASPIVVFESSSGASYSISYGADGVQHDRQLSVGDRITVSRGVLRMTFDSGVEALVEGPADLKLLSDHELAMEHGSCWFRVPQSGRGFTVSTERARIVDHGTEFGMRFNHDEGLQVHVAQGRVMANSTIRSDQKFSLGEGQAVEFDLQGVGKSIAAAPGSFCREFIDSLAYIHWSFDELVDGGFVADGPLAESVSARARLSRLAGPLHAKPWTSSRTAGRFGQALALRGDGVFAETGFEGIGGNAPRTVAAWVRVRQDPSSQQDPSKWSGNVLKVQEQPSLGQGSRVPQGSQGYILGYTNSGLISSRSALDERLQAGVTYTLSLQAAMVAGQTHVDSHVQLVAFDDDTSDDQRADCRIQVERLPGFVLAVSRQWLTQSEPHQRLELSFTPSASHPCVGKLLGVRLLKQEGVPIYDDIRLTAGRPGQAPRMLLHEDFESPKVTGFALERLPASGWVAANEGYGARISGLFSVTKATEPSILSWGSPGCGRQWSLMANGRTPLEWGVDLGGAALTVSSLSMSHDQWNHLAMVYTGRTGIRGEAEILFYLNGERIKSEPSTRWEGDSMPGLFIDTDVHSAEASPLRFGVQPGPVTHTVNSDLDEVYLIRGVLNPEQIRVLMEDNRIID